MSDRFEELLRNSAAEMPDPGDYRRLNRASLREPVHIHGRQRRRHPLLMVTACLALMVLVSGQLNPLGSDDFETTATLGQDAVGNTATIHKDEVSGSTLVFHGSDEDAKELLYQKAAGEGTLDQISCLEYMGEASWTFIYMHYINGVKRASNTIYNPEGYPNDELPNELHFTMTYIRDLYTYIRNTPPLRQYVLEIEGTPILMKEWEKWYPGYGKVTFRKGKPID